MHAFRSRATAVARSVVAAALALCVASGAARAQAVDCNALYAAIQAADSGARAGRLDQSAERQRLEIARTRRYADQLGCGQGLAGLFNGGSAQCAAVNDRLQRMEDNLSRIEAAAEQGGGDSRREALLARYNAVCVAGGNPADTAARAGQVFDPDSGRNPADLRGDPQDTDGVSDVPPGGDIMDGGGTGNAPAGQAICVRTCDGGYFPLTHRAAQDQLGSLDQLCQASCPNTEAKLYTMARSDDLNSATSVDGTPYTDLPSAFKFEKSFTPTCACKPPGQSWVEALADAEKLLSPDRHDVTVTESMSAQMAKPATANATPVPSRGKTLKGAKPLPVPASLPDLSMLRDGQKGLQAPTASNDSTGIGGPVHPERLVREGTGPMISAKGPDGVNRQIRLIVP